MGDTFTARWWHWLLGVLLPLHTVIFELLTHQMSGGLFDPMVTPWHALMMVALPIGVALILLSSGKGKFGLVGMVAVCFALPLILLIVWAIGWQHYDALLKMFFGLVFVFVKPSEFLETLFGDFIVSPIAGLAYLGPLSGCFFVVSLLFRRVNTSARAQCLMASIAALALLTYLESSAHSLEQAIASAHDDLQAERGVKAPKLLMTAKAKNVIARLSRQGMPFSSHGGLYAVGPVDIFGPWVFILNGRNAPVSLLHKTKWPDYGKLHEALWPGEEPKPRSWRGLSPWENYWIEHHSGSLPR